MKQRWRTKTGHMTVANARAVRMAGLTMERRFWDRISYEPNSGCWLWEGARSKQGYGTIGIYARQILVHRFSYELKNGPIPRGLVIDHICCTPACVNPEHLEAVTYGENTRRGYERNPKRPRGSFRWKRKHVEAEHGIKVEIVK